MPIATYRPEVSPNAATNGSRCICLLDDDLSMLKALDRLLTCEGHKTKKFSEPSAFLASIKQTQCPVAILDVWMPDMNGLEVQEVLRKESPEDARYLYERTGRSIGASNRSGGRRFRFSLKAVSRRSSRANGGQGFNGLSAIRWAAIAPARDFADHCGTRAERKRNSPRRLPRISRGFCRLHAARSRGAT
jgi:Response regulator